MTSDISVMDFMNSQFDRTVTWKDAEWMIGQWDKPFAIKGILSVEDAKKAVDVGASAIMVSNHGGRQMDGCPAPIEVLGEIVDTNYDCCFYSGCTDPAASNYASVADTNDGSCIYGDCNDDTLVTINFGPLAGLTYYEAINYAPNHTGCNPLHSNDYSCCRYYGCDDATNQSVNNYGDISSPNYTNQVIEGCPTLAYDTNNLPNNAVDIGTNSCCKYVSGVNE